MTGIPIWCKAICCVLARTEWTRSLFLFYNLDKGVTKVRCLKPLCLHGWNCSCKKIFSKIEFYHKSICEAPYFQRLSKKTSHPQTTSLNLCLLSVKLWNRPCTFSTTSQHSCSQVIIHPMVQMYWKVCFADVKWFIVSMCYESVKYLVNVSCYHIF